MAFVFARFLALGVTRDQDPANPWACFINGAGLVLTQKWACIQKRKQSEGKSAIIKVFCKFSPFGEDAWLALDIFWAGKDGIGGFTEGAIKVAGIRVSLVGFAQRKSWENKTPTCLESVPGRCLVPMASSSLLAGRLRYDSRNRLANSEERLKSRNHLSIQLEFILFPIGI